MKLLEVNIPLLTTLVGRLVSSCFVSVRAGQVYSSVAYGAPGFDFPLLSLSAMAMGHVRVLALDLCPLFPGAEYSAKYASANAKLKAIRDKYPGMGQVRCCCCCCCCRCRC